MSFMRIDGSHRSGMLGWNDSDKAPFAVKLPAAGLHFLDVSMFWGPAGGVRRVLTSKHDMLGDQGWRHTIMAPGVQGSGFLDCGGVAVPKTGGYRAVMNLSRAQRLIEEAQPDLVEAADPFMLAGVTLRASARLGIPSIAFCHSNLPMLAARLVGGVGGTATRRGRWAAERARAYLLNLYSRFDLVLAPSRGITQQLIEAGVKNAACQPLGVDCSVFTPAADDPAWRDGLRQRLRLPASTRLLVYTGRFAPEKNLPVLTQAMESLGRGHALLAVGAGPCVPRGPQVHVLPPEGDRGNLARLIASCDLYVHAGDQETFGLGVLEAMACGTPVVASAAAGTGELARDVGTVVRGHRPQDWAQAIRATLNEDVSCRTYKALVRARRHDWYWIIEQLSRRYLTLIHGDWRPPVDGSRALGGLPMGVTMAPTAPPP